MSKQTRAEFLKKVQEEMEKKPLTPTNINGAKPKVFHKPTTSGSVRPFQRGR